MPIYKVKVEEQVLKEYLITAENALVAEGRARYRAEIDSTRGLQKRERFQGWAVVKDA